MRGLTRYQIGVLLEIYNRELIDAKKTDGGPVQALRSVVGAFGVGISASEARRIITAFGGRNATSLTFTQFLDFFEWFVPEILCQLHQLALEGLKNMDTMEISELRLSQTDVGFIEATLGGKEEGKKIKLSEDRIQEFFSLHNALSLLTDRRANGADNVNIDLKLQMTLGNLLGASYFEYFGLDANAPSLDVFVRVEIGGREHTTKVFPARETPSFRESFRFELESRNDVPLSFFDATHWLQNTCAKISVYCVHFIDVKVAYHLLGVAKIPLVALLSGRSQRVSFCVNIEPIVPYIPMRLILAVTGDSESNSIVSHSTPMECLFLEKYFPWLKMKIKERYHDHRDFNTAMTRFQEAIEKFPAREYQIFGLDEYNQPHFLPAFVNKDKRLNLDKISIKELVYFISLHSDSVFSSNAPSLVQIRSLTTIEVSGVEMNEMERAVLLCSILKSKGLQAFVCIGDCHWQRRVCVVYKRDDDRSYEHMWPSVDCVNHLYDVEALYTSQGRAPVMAADERFLGQSHVTFSDWLKPVFLAINPSFEGRCEVSDYSANTQDVQEQEYVVLPMTGWPCDSMPHGFQVATAFDDESVYLYVGKERNLKKIKWEDIFRAGKSRTESCDWICAATIKGDDPSASKRAYDFLTFSSWIREKTDEIDLYQVNTMLLQCVREYVLNQKEQLITRVKCLRRLESCLLRALPGETQENRKQLLLRLRFYARIVVPSSHLTDAGDMYDKHRAEQDLFVIEELIVVNYSKGRVIDVNFALYSVVTWLYNKHKRQECKPNRTKVSYNDWERYIWGSCPQPQDYDASSYYRPEKKEIVEKYVSERWDSSEQGERKRLWKDFMRMLRYHRQDYFPKTVDPGKMLDRNGLREYALKMLKVKPNMRELTESLVDKMKNECCEMAQCKAGADAELTVDGLWLSFWMKVALSGDLADKKTVADVVGYFYGKLNSGIPTETRILQQSFDTSLNALKDELKKSSSDDIWSFVEYPMPIPHASLVVVGESILAVMTEKQRRDPGIMGYTTTGDEAQAFLTEETQFCFVNAVKEKSKQSQIEVTMWEADMIAFAKQFCPKKSEASNGRAVTTEEAHNICVDASKKLLEEFGKSIPELSSYAELMLDGIGASYEVKRLLAPRVESLGICVDIEKSFQCLQGQLFADCSGEPMYDRILAAFGTYNEATLGWTFKGEDESDIKAAPKAVSQELYYHYLTSYIQKEIIKMEREVIENGRILGGPRSRYEKLKRVLKRVIGIYQDPYMNSSSETRFMFRLTKHKTTDPTRIVDELMRSGMMSSALGCEAGLLVVQPFRYPLRAETTWVALVFIYPIPSSAVEAHQQL